MYPTTRSCTPEICDFQTIFLTQESKHLKSLIQATNNSTEIPEAICTIDWPRPVCKMSSPIGRGINFGYRPAARPFIALFVEVQKLIQKHSSKINSGTCGFLFGSSASLPFLYPLKLRGLYLLYKITSSSVAKANYAQRLRYLPLLCCSIHILQCSRDCGVNSAWRWNAKSKNANYW